MPGKSLLRNGLTAILQFCKRIKRLYCAAKSIEVCMCSSSFTFQNFARLPKSSVATTAVCRIKKSDTAHVQYLKDQRKNWKGSLFAFLDVARTLHTTVTIQTYCFSAVQLQPRWPMAQSLLSRTRSRQLDPEYRLRMLIIMIASSKRAELATLSARTVWIVHSQYKGTVKSKYVSH